MNELGRTFDQLQSLQEFSDFYDSLHVDELILVEFPRLYTSDPITRLLFQYLALHRRLSDIACFDADVPEVNRSEVIRTVTWLREQLEANVLPSVEPDMRERSHKALAGTDEYIGRWSHYPQAALMISVGARRPCGPYELGLMGEVPGKT